MNATANLETVTLEQVSQFLFKEARFLDDEQWDEWLACYAPEASSGCLPGMMMTNSLKTRSLKSP